MKKEVIIAIILGLGLGLLVTFGIYTARKTFNDSSANATPSPSPSTSPSIHNALTLLSPEDESLQFVKEIKITGTTDPRALVVIMVNAKPAVMQADTSGNFSLQTNLDVGGNNILVRAIDENGNIAEEQRTVVYSLTQLEDAPAASAAATATSSAKPKVTPTPTPKATPKPTPKASPSPSL